MTVENSKKIEQGKKTNANLVKIARRLFSQKGYSNTSTEEIVQVAGVTRGALYHHFNGKKGLFLAAFDDAQTDIENSLLKILNKPGDPWERFLTANHTFLKACMHPEIQQIVAIDAPAILGWHEWRRIDAVRTTRLLKDVLLNISSCAGLCSREPMMTVELQGEPPVKYVDLTPDKARDILEKHVLGGRIIKEYALAVGEERAL